MKIDPFLSTFSFTVAPEFALGVMPILKRYKTAIQEKRLLCIDFTTLSDYLWLLRGACQQLTNHGSKALLYLAAAVSDFYIPANKIVCIAVEYL